jgi:hypothetical protein
VWTALGERQVGRGPGVGPAPGDQDAAAAEAALGALEAEDLARLLGIVLRVVADVLPRAADSVAAALAGEAGSASQDTATAADALKEVLDILSELKEPPETEASPALRKRSRPSSPTSCPGTDDRTPHCESSLTAVITGWVSVNRLEHLFILQSMRAPSMLQSPTGGLVQS